MRRDAVFKAINELLPELYPFVHMCYANASLLNFGEFLLMSDEGAQQGDPLGPLMFCASALKLTKRMESEFNLWFLDDGSLGGEVDILLKDLELIRCVGEQIGLVLSEHKCEIVTDDPSVVTQFLAVMPNIRHVPCSNAVLLGAPVGDDSTTDIILHDKLTVFQRLADRLTSLNAHDALFLLKNCFSTPKLLYTLRCLLCYQSAVLPQYDAVIKNTLQVVLNIELNDVTWSQATLPVANGGLGVRLATDLALPAFLSSVAGSTALVFQLLPSRFHASAGWSPRSYVLFCECRVVKPLQLNDFARHIGDWCPEAVGLRSD